MAEIRYKHEPPWKANPPYGYMGVWCVSSDRGDRSEEYDVFDDPDESTARLGAAAPELLEAAIFTLRYLDQERRIWGAEVALDRRADQLRAAIAKAKGG